MDLLVMRKEISVEKRNPNTELNEFQITVLTGKSS